MIVATAGHVDHGKTSLIRALTGIDTDRLAEEKKRGMSIELGFAYADFGLDSLIGFVDVPGHERFVRNMLAGVAAIDCALLVVAADDGPMPQTLEHVAILELLGVSEAVVAITKIDRVEPARVLQVQEQVQALLEKSPMRGAPMVPVVATTGVGMQHLRAELIAVAQRNAIKPRTLAGNFRLAVDRVFSLTGAGLIVSGAVYAGQAQIGDRLIVSPGGMEVRVRSIHANNVASNEARCGVRCALNLSGAGLEKELIHRGDWIVAPCLHAPTQRLDVDLRILPTASRALIDGVTVQLYLAAASVSARVATLGAKHMLPGTTGLAQLALDEPIAALYGDRFVLRDQGGRHTIGGGSVIDPFAPARGRSKPIRLRELEALRSPSARDALRQVFANGENGTAGVDWTAFLLARNLTASDSDLLEKECGLQLLDGNSGPIAFEKAQWDAMRAFMVSVLKERHQQHPDSQGLSQGELLGIMRSEFCALPLPIFRAMVESQVQAKEIERHGLSLCLPGWVPRLNAQDQARMDALRVELSQAGLRPPIVGELSKTLNRALPDLMADLRRMSSGGHLVAVANNRYFLPETVLELVWVALVLEHDSSGQGFDAAAYRDASGIGRNLTIQVLEFLDRQGFTRFARNRRWIVATALPAALKIRLQDINRKEGEKP